MNIWQAAGWYRALSISERIALSGQPDEVDIPLAQRRLQQWRDAADLQDPQIFAAYLESLSVDEQQMMALLGETDDSLKRRVVQPPEWLQNLQQLYSLPAAEFPELSESFKQRFKEYELMIVVTPVARWLYDQLEEKIRALSATTATSLFDNAMVRDAFFEQYLTWVLWVFRKPMVLTLNISRIEKVFAGDTAKQRYEAFVDYYRDSEKAAEILMEYPLAARALIQESGRFIDVCMCLLQRLVDDYERLRQCFFNGEDSGEISAIAINLSDPHRGGQRVAKISFSDRYHIIYKPKSLAIDIAFQQLLGTINNDAALLPFRVLQVLDRGDYGWVECVLPAACTDESALREFYERQGMNIALLYMLHANDFHYENLIAANEQAVLIDLETLVQPRITDLSISRTHADPSDCTVLSLGMLPYQMGFVGNLNHEVGGLGGASGQQMTVNALTGFESDQLQFQLQDMGSPGAQNLPQFAGQNLSAEEITAQIIKGFTAMYEWLVTHREMLLEDGGVLHRFAEQEIRFICRGTEQYSALISAVWHPDMLQNALHKDRLFSKLWRRGYRNSLFRKVYPYEIEALERGDVPLFTTTVNSKRLKVTEHHTLPELFNETGREVFNKRLATMGEADKCRQQWLIKSAMDVYRPKHSLQTYSIESLPPALATDLPVDGYLQEAVKIGERLDKLLITHLDGPNWFDIGLVDAARRISQLKPMDWTLYDGLSGMLLFFSYLAREAQSERASEISDLIVARCNQLFDSNPRIFAGMGTGAYEGWPGMVYTYLQLAIVRQDDAFLDRALRICLTMLDDLQQPDDFDFISGVTGTLCIIIRLANQTGHPQLKKTIEYLADWLVRTAVPQSSGVAWVNAITREYPLTGLAHGTTGVVLALSEAAVYLQRDDYVQTIKQAVAYEDSWFSTEQKTWGDARLDRNHEGQYAWCHGAPGIGLGRAACAVNLHQMNLQDDQWLAALDASIRGAATATLKHGFGGSHSLCHGDIGNLEIVRYAANYLQDKSLQSGADDMALRVLQSVQQNGYRCGGVVNRELLNLMLGVAGIGYGFMQLHNPDQVPSILLLDT